MEYIDMTDEEYDALDEELTRTIPKLSPNGSGWLSLWEIHISGLSTMVVNYLLTRASNLKFNNFIKKGSHKGTEAQSLI